MPPPLSIKVRVSALVAIASLIGLVAWFSRRSSAPLDPRKIEKTLTAAAKSSQKTQPACESFFSDWDALMREKSEMNDRRLGRLTDQVGRYPGIPSDTLAAWKVLAASLPKDSDVDVSYAFGLTDCQYGRFARTAARLLSMMSPYRKTLRGSSRPARAVFSVLTEVLDRPVSRQVLHDCVTLAMELKRSGWIDWAPDDTQDWARIHNYLIEFNKRADKREGEITRNISGFKSFQDIPVGARKGIASQIRYSFTETEYSRRRVKALIGKFKWQG